jgi:hypothetical protein
MSDPAGGRVFTILKVLNCLSLASMGAAIVYAAMLAVQYWPDSSM